MTTIECEAVGPWLSHPVSVSGLGWVGRPVADVLTLTTAGRVCLLVPGQVTSAAFGHSNEQKI